MHVNEYVLKRSFLRLTDSSVSAENALKEGQLVDDGENSKRLESRVPVHFRAFAKKNARVVGIEEPGYLAL